MIIKYFSANLSDALSQTDVYLPLSSKDNAALLSLLGEDGESIYLTIADDMYKEYVLATLTAGTIVLQRGIDSTAQKFPKGACVFFENSVPVTKWLICNYECCADDCEVEEITAQGLIMPAAQVGVAWEGTAVFGGGQPMVFGVTGMPSWMSAVYGGNFVRLSGTPTAAGTYTIAVAGSNDRGRNIAIQTVLLTVTAQ